MKAMTSLKLKFTIGIGMAAFVMIGVANNAVSQTHDDDKLGAAEIAKKSLAAYAALTSYSDEGKIVASVGATNEELTFSTKLSRPNLYRISWSQIGGPIGTGSVWSAGEGDFMKVKDGAPTKEPTMERALAGATRRSGRAADTVPELFFNLHGLTNLKTNGSNRLQVMAHAGTRKPDEKVEGIDCYVVGYETNAIAQTLRIGKKDFLIRQIESSVKAAALNALLEEQAKKANTVIGPNSRIPGDGRRVETHSSVSINPSFTKTDFAP